jgi:hypothetical protein
MGIFFTEKWESQMIVACGMDNDVGFDLRVFHVMGFQRVILAEMDDALVVDVVGERREINSLALGVNLWQVYHLFSESSDSTVADVFSVEVWPRLGGFDEDDWKYC